ncbi:conserved hypothetical protein [Vibrio coralliirubri]|uniref:Uncharacterized protein n=1 Tax=Vibrio coralliirubri TaxID=1516159 RepID=A0AA86WSN0_9VIBR|nr:glycosyltransferase [Vibrio coralliirubri]CDU10774.1 conserved hypothetical protein [Vibrio coralliirubri]
MKIAYILPRVDFFSRGYGGCTSHANGFVTGCIKNDVNVDVYSGPDFDKLYKDLANNSSVQYTIGRSRFFPLFILFLMFELIKRKNEYDIVIVRYSFLAAPLISCILRLAKIDFIYEVNSFGYQQISKQSKLKNIFKKIESIFAGFSKVNIYVSETLSRKLSFTNRSYIMPNAGPEYYLGDDIILQGVKDNAIDLVFLGRTHSYYDFPTIENAIKNSERKVVLHIYGEDGVDTETTRYYGQYDIAELSKSLYVSKNTILILPYKKGTIAEIGSPTKLFDYFSLGLPILSTKVGQINDLYSDDIFFYENSSELVSLLESWNLKIDIGRRKDWYLSNHTWSSRVREFLDSDGNS